MKLIGLSQNLSTQVDDEDYENLSLFKWSAHKSNNKIYAIRNAKINNKKVTIRMHAQIMSSSYIDHIDENGLNNQKSNLRKASKSQNGSNVGKRQKPCSSKFKGVSWSKQKNKWQVRICIQYKETNLGLFENEIDAAKAYDAKAKELFGEFANLNFQ